MIETDYIVKCDRQGCASTLHSRVEFGPIVLGSLWKRLNKLGWYRINGLETCPECVRKLWPKRARKEKR